MEHQPITYIQEEKELVNSEMTFPDHGKKQTEHAIGKNTKTKYLFDVNRGRMELKKVTLQNRMQKTIILLRLDVGGPPHSNPPIHEQESGEVLYGTHMHVYSEEFGDSMAYKLNHPILKKINPKFDFNKFNTEDHIELYKSFLEFCRVENSPVIQGKFL